jgi:hypothetical protein
MPLAGRRTRGDGVSAPAYGIGRVARQDRVDDWIAAIAPGRRFVDIGGIGEYGCNERCGWARRCGARDVTMADIMPDGHAMWAHYRSTTRAHGITDLDLRPGLDVNNPKLPETLGRFDIVHATGLLYHAPNPVQMLLNTRRVVGEYLITNTVIIPDVVENALGRVAFPASAALFLPALRGQERAVLRQHYLDKFNLGLDTHAPMQPGASMPYMASGEPSPWPYWWFFTASAFERALEMLEMRILDRHTWEDHAHFVFLRRR